MSEASSMETGRLMVAFCREHHARAHTLFSTLGLYRGQPGILMVLWAGDGRTHSELAQALRVQPATITKMVQRLEQAGFVTRRPDPRDQRVSRVYLTDAARAIQADIRQADATLVEESLRGFSPDEVDVLRTLLRRMYDNLVQVNDAS